MVIELKALPQAGLSKIGDCGPCCIGALAGVSAMQVYDDLFGGVKDGMDYDQVLKAIKFYSLEYNDSLPEDIADHPRWKQWGRPGWFNFFEWFNNAYTKTCTGYVGIAQVNIKGTGLTDEYTDHWVLIKGVHFETNNYDDKLLVISCPTKGEYTIHVKEFLKNYGGYNTIWVKPKQ
jgi:hypothetical protein